MLQGQPKGLYALALANTGERFACDFHIILASEIRLYGR